MSPLTLDRVVVGQYTGMRFDDTDITYPGEGLRDGLADWLTG